MKNIKIYLMDGNIIEAQDNDNGKLTDFIRQFSTCLERSCSSIIHFSSASIIIIPSKINSIVITDDDIENDEQSFLSDEELDQINKEDEEVISD